MAALKKWQHWRAPHSQFGARSPDSSIRSEVNQRFIEDLNCVVTSSSGYVDLRHVQIELHFIAPQTQGRLAKFHCRSPLPLGTGNGNSKKRKVIRVFLLQLGSLPKVFRGLG
jgi:hypothetical protein